MFDDLYGPSRGRNTLALAGLTWLAIASALLCRFAWLLPILQPLPLLPLFYRTIRDNEWNETLYYVFEWILVSVLTVAALATLFPLRTADTVWNSEPFRREIVAWLVTGETGPGNVHVFPLLYLRTAGVFLGTALVSGGLLALPIGALLLNTMSYCYGSLIANADRPLIVLLFGWPVWSLFRVLGFCLCGIALSGLMPAWIRRRQIEKKKTIAFLGSGLGLLAADVLLQWGFAPAWQEVLQRAAGLQP